MGSLAEERTRHFYTWERRGRGSSNFPYPVRLEPPFAPFRYLRETRPAEDDGRHHTMLSRFLERFSAKREEPAPRAERKEEAPEPYEDGPRSELALLPPRELASTPSPTEAWLKSLSAL